MLALKVTAFIAEVERIPNSKVVNHTKYMVATYREILKRKSTYIIVMLFTLVTSVIRRLHFIYSCRNKPSFLYIILGTYQHEN